MASKGIRDQVAIVGMGCTPFGEHWDSSTDDMLLLSSSDALKSAGVALDDVDAFWLGTMGSGVSGLTLSRPLKIDYKPVTRLENMCATGSEAFRNACYAVASGAFDVAMAIGVEKLKDSGYSGLVGGTIPNDGTLPTLTAPASFSLLAPAYAKKYGVDEAEMKDVLTRIAWKNHHNGALNPRAQFRKEVAKDTIACSPLVAGPLGIFDCSGVSDGSAAAIVVRSEDAHKYTDKPLFVKALSFVAGPAAGPIDPSYDYTSFREVVRSAEDAYAQAGIANPRAELAMAEVHDCFTPPSWSSWRTSGSPSAAWPGRKCWPARSISTASSRSTPTAASSRSGTPSGRPVCGCCSRPGSSCARRRRPSGRSRAWPPARTRPSPTTWAGRPAPA
jgi:acetyl-CoA C-acetyltransferase